MASDQQTNLGNDILVGPSKAGKTTSFASLALLSLSRLRSLECECDSFHGFTCGRCAAINHSPEFAAELTDVG